MINIQNLTKIYPTGVCANEDISICVNPGEIVGIVGVNGSGKTTLIRQLLKIIVPTKGKIIVDDTEDYLGKLSYAPQFPALYPSLTVRETIILVLRYQQYKKKDAIKKSEEIVKQVGLERIENQHTYTLSGGQQKLLSLACALASDKKYLILDEPTSMVDIVTKEIIWSTLKKEKAKRGILIASHDMGEIKRLCDRVIILKNGKVVYSGSTARVGEKCCIISLKIDKAIKEIDLILGPNCKYEIDEKLIKVVGKTISDVLISIEKIKKVADIESMSCEYPAFYEGVLDLVKNN